MPTPHNNSGNLVVSVGAQCHVGKERTENQDRVTRAATPFGDLFVAADGVGGYQGGSEAAQATVEGFVSYLNTHGNLSLADALQQAAHTVSAELQRRSAANQALHGMGSTVVLCVINGSVATYAHAGDSRVYLVRDLRLTQLTRDHSVMERMISEGLLTPAQAREHPDASVLTRAIGQAADVTLDIGQTLLHADDALLLCSDGLWAYAPHTEMEAVAASETMSASGVAAALLNLALEGGGGDNISIQFLRFKALNPVAAGADKAGTSRKLALPVVALLASMAVGAVGMHIWNQNHAPGQATSEMAEVSHPEKVIHTPATPPPPERKPSPSTAAPVAPKKTPTKPHPASAEKPKNAKKTATSEAPLPAATPPPAPADSAGLPVKTAVTVIVGSDNATADWADRLANLPYLAPSQQPGDEDCLALEKSSAALFYSPEQAKVAAQIQSDLSLLKSALVKMSEEDLKKCGGEEIVAMPAKPSLGSRIKGKAEAGAQAAKTTVKSTVDAVRKKTEGKGDGSDNPPTTDNPQN